MIFSYNIMNQQDNRIKKNKLNFNKDLDKKYTFFLIIGIDLKNKFFNFMYIKGSTSKEEKKFKKK